MKKKAIVEVQFNWIYMAIVGAIILMVFVGIAINIRKSANIRLEADAIKYFDEIFTSLQGSENTEHSLSLPGMQLVVDTYADNCHYYTLGDSDIEPQSTKHLPIFSPNTITKKILSYSLGWDVPFRANYFLYLTSPTVSYAFINGNGINDLYDEFPEHLTSEFVNHAIDITNRNYNHIRFITATNPEEMGLDNSIRKMKDSQVSAIQIIPTGQILNGGKIKYFRKVDRDFEYEKETYYLDKETLFAMIFSENVDSYECNLKEKAIKRINEISNILIDRMEEIQTIDLLPQCDGIMDKYNTALSKLVQLKTLTGNMEITKENIETLKSIKDNLDAINTEINKKSCPTVY